MKTNYKIMLGIFVGAVLGAAGVSAIRAQQAKVLPGYVVAEVEVNDPVAYKQYRTRCPGQLPLMAATF